MHKNAKVLGIELSSFSEFEQACFLGDISRCYFIGERLPTWINGAPAHLTASAEVHWAGMHLRPSTDSAVSTYSVDNMRFAVNTLRVPVGSLIICLASQASLSPLHLV